MVVYTDKKKLIPVLHSIRKQNQSVGFVPTMGALHQGHLALVKRALKENDAVVVSIYVNPTQFDNKKDLDKYPRLLENDSQLLDTLNGNILIYAPNNTDIYGGAISSQRFIYGGLEHQMEGKHRKGHFDGVGTILTILFDIVQPNRAYFGEKDFQQLQIVRKLVKMNKIPVKIVGHPIVRESNGLAMSSRNKRLSKNEFDDAAFIYKVLSEVKQKFKTLSIKKINNLISERFLNHPSLKLEYFQIADEKNLVEAIRKRKGNKYRAFIAVYCGNVRLIDNIALSI